MEIQGTQIIKELLKIESKIISKVSKVSFIANKHSDEYVNKYMLIYGDEAKILDIKLIPNNDKAHTITMEINCLCGEDGRLGILGDLYLDESLEVSNRIDKIIDHGIFENFYYLKSIDMGILDFSKVTKLTNMFKKCIRLKRIDLHNLDIHNVTDMRSMFEDCGSLEVINIANLDTHKVTDMSNLFKGCIKVSKIQLDNINTSNVTNMRNMFSECTMLNSLDISSFNTSKVENMSRMFMGCSRLELLNLSNFDTKNVKNFEYMFGSVVITNDRIDDTYYSDWHLRTLDLHNFRLDSAKNIDGMFDGCVNLEKLDITNFRTDNLETKEYRRYGNHTEYKVRLLFNKCNNLKYIKIGEHNILDFCGHGRIKLIDRIFNKELMKYLKDNKDFIDNINDGMKF